MLYIVVMLLLSLANCSSQKEVFNFRTQGNQVSPGTGKVTTPEKSTDSPDQKEPIALRMGTFNVMRLGDQPKKFKRLVKLVEDLDFFAATEILSPQAAEQLWEALEVNSDKKWEMDLSPFANGESSYREYVAFFFNPERIKRAPNNPYCQQIADEINDNRTCFIKDQRRKGKPDYERDPYLGTYKIGNQIISVLGLHLIYGEQSNDGLVRRQHELSSLKQTAIELTEVNPDHRILLMGDFNLELPPKNTNNPGHLKYIPTEFWNHDVEMQVLVQGPTTIGKGNYDHLVMVKNKNLSVTDGSDRIHRDFNLDSKTEKRQYRYEVSDHFPVSAEFIFKQ